MSWGAKPRPTAKPKKPEPVSVIDRAQITHEAEQAAARDAVRDPAPLVMPEATEVPPLRVFIVNWPEPPPAPPKRRGPAPSV